MIIDSNTLLILALFALMAWAIYQFSFAPKLKRAKRIRRIKKLKIYETAILNTKCSAELYYKNSEEGIEIILLCIKHGRSYTNYESSGYIYIH